VFTFYELGMHSPIIFKCSNFSFFIQGPRKQSVSLRDGCRTLRPAAASASAADVKPPIRQTAKGCGRTLFRPIIPTVHILNSSLDVDKGALLC